MRNSRGGRSRWIPSYRSPASRLRPCVRYLFRVCFFFFSLSLICLRPLISSNLGLPPSTEHEGISVHHYSILTQQWRAPPTLHCWFVRIADPNSGSGTVRCWVEKHMQLQHFDLNTAWRLPDTASTAKIL